MDEEAARRRAEQHIEGLRRPLVDTRPTPRQRRRTRQMLMAGAAFVVLALVALAFFHKLDILQGSFLPTSPPPTGGAAAKAAASIASRHFPHEVLKAMNLGADPCTDFYEFSCGTFQLITQVEPDQNEWARAWSGVSARNNELLREVIETDRGIAGEFWRSCNNMSRINELGSAPLKPYLEKLKGLKACAMYSNTVIDKSPCGLKTLWPLVAEWQRIDVKVFFDWSVEVDPHEPTRYALNLMQDGITLPDPVWYYSESPDAKSKLKGLRDVIVKVFKLTGEDSRDAEYDADSVIRLETSMAKLFKDAAHERTHQQTSFSLSSIDALAPNLDLPSVLKALAGDLAPKLQSTPVLVRNPDYFKGLNKLLVDTPASHLRAYMLFRMAFILGADMGDEWLDIGQQLQKVVVGQEHRVPRWYKCFHSVNNALPDYVGKVFVQRYFSFDTLNAARDMLDRMRDEFQEELMSVPWMDDVTKSKATYKLADLFFSIGFPPKWADYSGLDLSGDFVQDGDRLYKWYIHHAFERLSRKVDRERWGTTSPAMVDAFYSYDKNGIFVPAGMLQKPFFDTDYRAARNYGGIGTILGHEMTHGFDDQGRKFNPQGRLEGWWTTPDVKAFESRAGCVRDLYSSFKLNGRSVSGELTLGENIADIGGVRLAYKAFAKLMREKEGSGQPSTTDKQLFFVSQAQNWCTKGRKKAENLQLLTDPHAPDRFRVNGPLSQISEFQQAFGCPAGSLMAPKDRCRVW
mmetsp:Transcript_36762/g.88853  ORF Transcript_36762/g.88853 Transcript_36762/m.88853 type:complete len:744 (+) Transcript_36762:244-2475(+)